MATQDWPVTRAFRPARFALGLDVSQSSYTGFYSGNVESVSHAARLLATVTLPPTKDPVYAGQIASFLMGLKSSGDFVRFGPAHKRDSLGTLSGSPTVNGAVGTGARSVVLANARAGKNLLRRSDDLQSISTTGWSTGNATFVSGATDPNGGTTAYTLSRTTGGLNHYLNRTVTTSANASRTYTFGIWLKRGTLTGNVTLRVRDGAGTEAGSRSIAITTAWVYYAVTATFPSGAAADIQLIVDPDDDVGSAGVTLFVWFGALERSTATQFNAVLSPDTSAGPDPSFSGAALTRKATGNHYITWQYVSAATAGLTFTFSVWLKAGTLTGTVNLRLRDAAATEFGLLTVTPGASWVRYSVSGTFSGAAADVFAIIDPSNDAGSAGDSLEVAGVQLELGASATTHYPLPTALGGDVISIGGNLLMVAYAGATGDFTGAITLPLALPVQKAISNGAVVTTGGTSGGVTGLWQLDDGDMQFVYDVPLIMAGLAIPFRQVVV